jgi:outer membrane biosynthesis protein TonB
MDRTQKRCLVGSVAFHGILMTVLITAAAFAPKPEIPSVPFLELLPTDLKLTDGDQIGGGNPNAKQPPAQSSQPPSQPLPPPTTPKSPPKEVTKDIKPPVPPKIEKRAEPKPDKPEKPEPKNEKVAAKDLPANKNEPKEKAQDVDNTRRATKPAVQVAGKKVTRPTNTEEESRKEREAAERREREEREEREASDRRREAIESANAARRNIASRIQSGAETISSGVGSASVLEIPGPGGQAYAPYISYLGTFYRERWKSPRSVSRARASVGASVEVAKDGTVLDFKLTEPSGVRDVDESVREVLRRYPKLRPLPDTTKDSKRIFTIQFRLDADSTL